MEPACGALDLNSMKRNDKDIFVYASAINERLSFFLPDNNNHGDSRNKQTLRLENFAQFLMIDCYISITSK